MGLLTRWTFIALVLLIAWIGFLFVTRGTAVRHVRGVGADGTPVAPGEPQFPLTVAVLTGAVLTAGNRVELALNGDGTYPRLWDDLQSARQSITVQMYYGIPGRVADSLRAILIERARSGVCVRFLYDAFGTHDIPGDHLAALRSGGVLAVPFRPLRLSTLYVLQNRTHVRGVVIDGRVGWTGGFGIDDKWLGDGHSSGAWRETNVRFEGPAVRQLQAAFAAAWTEATGVLLSGRASVDRYEDGVAMAGLLNATPTLGSTAAERFLALSIAGRGRRSTSRTPTSRRTRTSSSFSPRLPGVVWTCGSCWPDRGRTYAWRGPPGGRATSASSRPAYEYGNGNRRRCTPRRSSPTGSGPRSVP